MITTVVGRNQQIEKAEQGKNEAGKSQDGREDSDSEVEWDDEQEDTETGTAKEKSQKGKKKGGKGTKYDDGKDIRTGSSIVTGAGAPTLVVAPTSAVSQRADEISRYTKEGTLSVMTYYQNRQSVSLEDLLAHDIVLTTYPILEYEYRTIV